MAAYIRGYRWHEENPDSEDFLIKAARDYADKQTAPGSVVDMLANQAAHVSLGLSARFPDINDAVRHLCAMTDEFLDIDTYDPEKM